MKTPTNDAREAIYRQLLGHLDGPAALRLAQEQVEMAVAAAQTRLLPEHARQFEAGVRVQLTMAMLQGLGR